MNFLIPLLLAFFTNKTQNTNKGIENTQKIMTEEEIYFTKIGTEIQGAVKSQMFGKPCFKIGKKAFICFFKNAMVFKLNGKFHQEALSLKASQLFDPSGKNRPMKEWVQVPFDYKEKWRIFAEQSAEYVIE